MVIEHGELYKNQTRLPLFSDKMGLTPEGHAKVAQRDTDAVEEYLAYTVAELRTRQQDLQPLKPFSSWARRLADVLEISSVEDLAKYPLAENTVRENGIDVNEILALT